MACIYDTVIENVSGGERLQVNGKGEWCIRVWGPNEEDGSFEDGTFKVTGEHSGRLYTVERGTHCISGYGWGHR